MLDKIATWPRWIVWALFILGPWATLAVAWWLA